MDRQLIPLWIVLIFMVGFIAWTTVQSIIYTKVKEARRDAILEFVTVIEDITDREMIQFTNPKTGETINFSEALKKYSDIISILRRSENDD